MLFDLAAQPSLLNGKEELKKHLHLQLPLLISWALTSDTLLLLKEWSDRYCIGPKFSIIRYDEKTFAQAQDGKSSIAQNPLSISGKAA